MIEQTPFLSTVFLCGEFIFTLNFCGKNVCGNFYLRNLFLRIDGENRKTFVPHGSLQKII